MHNETTLLLSGVMLLALGAIIGALIYHLIVHRFSKDLKKQLDKTIKNYENFVLEKAQDSLKEFEVTKNHFTNISNHIIKEQKKYSSIDTYYC
jgi:gas vesicle protein